MAKLSKDTVRVAKPLPIFGQIAALACARETLNEKGAVIGAVDLALDLIPFVGRVKGLFELFGGEIVNEKNIRTGFKSIRKALDEIEQVCLEEKLPNEETAAIPTEEKEERYYPENSARAALMRTKNAIKPAYEKRVFTGLADPEPSGMAS